MIAVFGCAGHFDNAISVIKAMLYFDDPTIWARTIGCL